MGVYLSEPKTDKHSATGSKGGMEFQSAEMQGISFLNQAGEKPWKMQLFINLMLEMEIPYLLCLMDMEVCQHLSRSLG